MTISRIHCCSSQPSMISPQQGALAMDGGEPALRSTCTGTPMPPHVRSQAPVATEPARTAHATIRTSAPAMPSAPSSAKLGACLEGGGARSVRITRPRVADGTRYWGTSVSRMRVNYSPAGAWKVFPRSTAPTDAFLHDASNGPPRHRRVPKYAQTSAARRRWWTVTQMTFT